MHLHTLIGASRFHFYTRLLPWCTGLLAATFTALWLWSVISSREDQANAFLAVGIFMVILTALSIDVARMLARLEKSVTAAPIVEP